MLPEWIEIEGVGKVLFERSGRARRLNVSIQPFRGVRVAVPYNVSLRSAVEFVKSRNAWICRNMRKIKQFETNARDLGWNDKPVNVEEAWKTLTGRLEELASENGFRYNKVCIRNQKTRWGSCSSRGNISLNMNLVRLPQHLMDYVILHELVHTRIKSHSKEFWTELGKFVNDVKALKREMKQYLLPLAKK